MHIPDGYLGPGTFIASLDHHDPDLDLCRKGNGIALGSKRAPLLALASAFAFVIMMFNLPVPGGKQRTCSGRGYNCRRYRTMGCSYSHIYSPGTAGANVWGR